MGEVTSDFTFTQRLKKKIAYQFLALLQPLYKNKLASLHTSRRPVSKQGLSEAAGYYAGKQKTMPVLEEFTKMFSKSLKKRSSEKMELSHYCCGFMECLCGHHEFPQQISDIVRVFMCWMVARRSPKVKFGDRQYSVSPKDKGQWVTKEKSWLARSACKAEQDCS